MKKGLLPRCLLVFNTVWIIFGLLIKDSNSPMVLRPAECGYLLDRSIDWGGDKQQKASGPWALSLPALGLHHSCAQGTVTSLGLCCSQQRPEQGRVRAQWGAVGPVLGCCLAWGSGQCRNQGEQGRALALGSRVHCQLLWLPWVM